MQYVDVPAIIALAKTTQVEKMSKQAFQRTIAYVEQLAKEEFAAPAVHTYWSTGCKHPHMACSCRRLPFTTMVARRVTDNVSDRLADLILDLGGYNRELQEAVLLVIDRTPPKEVLTYYSLPRSVFGDY